jgi:hypothetical protein
VEIAAYCIGFDHKIEQGTKTWKKAQNEMLPGHQAKKAPDPSRSMKVATKKVK